MTDGSQFTSELTTSQKQRFSNYQVRIFIVSWLAYAAFYFCRKNFSIAMISLKEQGFTDDDLAWCVFGYSLTYMVGQFINGVLSDKWGPRIMVGIGLLVSVLSNVYMGFCSTLVMLIASNVVNGLAQSTGWSGTVKNMTPWFSTKVRGVVMAWFATCYVLGGFLATRFAGWAVSDGAPFADLGWQRVFWFPAAITGIVCLIYSLFTKNNPTDAGLPELAENVSETESKAETNETEPPSSNNQIADILEVLQHPQVWVTGVMYFFLKLTRYSLLFWTPLYLVEHLGMDENEAGATSSYYDLVGFLGTIFAGYLSDKVFNSRRFPVGTIMMAALAITFWFHPVIVSLGTWGPAISLSLLGFLTFGPDTLMTGAGAMDLGSSKRAATAVGVINGVGSCGQLLSPLILVYMKNAFGWDSVFFLFIGCSTLGAILLGTQWNYGKKN